MRRERPVGLRMEGLTDRQKQLASVVAEFFARASNLPFAVSTGDSNLFIMRTPSLNDGDTISLEYLKKFGLPEETYSWVRETTGWSGGCGFYNFRARNGRISGSIIGIDDRLTDRQTDACLLKVIAASFGINLRRSKVDTFARGAHFITYILEISAICSKDYENNPDKTKNEKEFITVCIKDSLDFHFGIR